MDLETFTAIFVTAEINSVSADSGVFGLKVCELWVIGSTGFTVNVGFDVKVLAGISVAGDETCSWMELD